MNLKIAVDGTRDVSLSIATLLSQHYQLKTVDIILEKVTLINDRKSPSQDSTLKIPGRKGFKSDSHLRDKSCLQQCGLYGDYGSYGL